MRYLHSADNGKLIQGDKLAKSRPFCIMINQRFLNAFQFYLIQCDPYSGKGDHNAKLGLARSVFARLVNKLPSEFSFDNLFTSLALPNHLSKNGIGAISALRANCTDHCPMKDIKVIGKKNNGSYDYRYHSANKLIVVRWNDNSIVTLASKCQPVNPVGTTKQYSRKEKKNS